MGELAYAAECKRLAFGWVRENPGASAVVSLKRFFLLLEWRTQRQ